MHPTLRALAAEERAVIERLQHAVNVLTSELRHEFSEDVGAEYVAWREVSLACKALNDRACIWGRPGISWAADDTRPFDLGPIKQVSSSDIDAALAGLIPNWHKSGGVSRLTLDGTYFCIQPDDFARVIGWDWIDQKPYIAEKFDCEDFAFAFKGRFSTIWEVNCVGMVVDWSCSHAYNVAVLATGDAILYEPQDDTIPVIGTGIHKLTNGIILI